ncbi:hypothetical protein EMIT0P12_20397 [Pseudomonas sp. IT-P12]
MRPTGERAKEPALAPGVILVEGEESVGAMHVPVGASLLVMVFDDDALAVRPPALSGPRSYSGGVLDCR